MQIRKIEELETAAGAASGQTVKDYLIGEDLVRRLQREALRIVPSLRGQARAQFEVNLARLRDPRVIYPALVILGE